MNKEDNPTLSQIHELLSEMITRAESSDEIQSILKKVFGNR